MITGGCGFVGSNIAICYKKENPNAKIYVFDNLKRRGSELNLNIFKSLGIEFIHGDIRNEEDFEGINNIDLIIDASAEPSVTAGIDGGAKQLVNINLFGTINILNLAVKLDSAFIFLSTSRIYPINNLNEITITESKTRFKISDNQNLNGISKFGINEKFPLNGYRSIYGATKLAAELLIQEYQHFYKLKAVINRCGVIAGPRQMGKVDQGVTVLWVARHYWKKPLSYFGFGGSGKQVRDVLHIDDLYDLIKLQMSDMDLFNGQLFNIGGGLNSSFSLLELSQICREVTGNKLEIKKVEEDRIADIKLYITNNSKITKFCGWTPKRNTKTVVNDIFKWIRTNESKLKDILN